MSRTLRWEATKDVPVRSKGQWGSGSKQGAPERNRLTIGKKDGYVHRSFIQFEFDQADIGTITKAELVMKVTATDYDPGDLSRVTVHRCTKSWPEGSGTGWQGDDSVNPAVATGRASYANFGDVQVGDVVRTDITAMVGPWLKEYKRWMDGTAEKAGWDKPNFGLRLKTKEDGPDLFKYAFQVHSREAASAADRPYIEVTYEPPNYAPDLISTISPAGSVLPNQPFTGEFGDPNGDAPDGIKVQVRRQSNENVVWDPPTFPFDITWVDQGGTWLWNVENPGSEVLKDAIAYEWRAKGFDLGGKDSGWTPWRGFSLSGTPPTVTPRDIGTLETLVGYEFLADWATSPSEEVVSYRVQMQAENGLWSQPLWDQTFLPLTQEEQSSQTLRWMYSGPRLAAGTYDLRLQVVDSQGASSGWSVVKQVVLTIGSEQDLDDGGDYLPPNLTGYERGRPRIRVVLRDIDGPNRGPGTVKAIIEDAHNLGFRSVVNEPGEMYFTLTSLHPQAGECEPFQRHYAVQQYRNGGWYDIHNGLLVDFDAGDDDIIIYGADYLGVLARSVDTRFPPPGTNINASHADGGSKYKNEKISDIVWDQLREARDDVDSPTAFFFKGTWQELNTEVSIYSSFKARLDFIRGLLESHRQGTGRRTRLKPRQDPSQQDRWEWDLRNNAGTDRDNLRLSYGSLLQNFRVIAMGEDYATRGHGVGTEPNSVKPRYYVSPVVGQSDFLTQTFGNLQRVEVYDDIIDMNDLKRRVKQGIKEWSKVGKRLRLAIRVHGVNPYDGYDLADNVPVDIDRGLVETDRYGSGYWTIWGLEYRVYPDGHDELTWAVKPREDDELPDNDLIPSDPIHETPEWVLGSGPPPPEPALMSARYYMDIETGTVYIRPPTSGPDDSYGWVEEGTIPGDGSPPPGYPGDNTAPSEPTDFVVEPLDQLQSDGSLRTVFLAAWLDAPEADIMGYEVEWDRTYLDEIGDPIPADWVTVQSTRIGRGVLQGVLSPVIGGAGYEFRIRSYDMEGLSSAWVYHPRVVANPDSSAPAIPDLPDVAGGYRLLGVTWSPSDAPDLSYYDVRYRLVGAEDWTYVRTKSSRYTVTGLDLDVEYEVGVRAVDMSGNVRVSGDPDDPLDPEVIDLADNVDVGWSETATAFTSSIFPEDIVFDDLVANFISTGLITADQVQGGSLLLGQPGLEGELRIYDSQGRPTGAWGDFGWVIADPENPGRAIWGEAGAIYFTSQYDWDGTEDRTTDEKGLVTVTAGIEQGIPTTTWTTAIDWRGVNAESITFGSQFGGNNRVLNAGYELQDYDTATLVTKEYTDNSDWGSPTSNINTDVSGSELRMANI